MILLLGIFENELMPWQPPQMINKGCFLAWGIAWYIIINGYIYLLYVSLLYHLWSVKAPKLTLVSFCMSPVVFYNFPDFWCKVNQTHLSSLLQIWNQPFVPGGLVPFSGKWYLETITCDHFLKLRDLRF